MIWNLFPFKGDFSFGKSQKLQGAKSGCWGTESPAWLDISPKVSVQGVMCEQVHCHDQAANHQLLIAVAFWIIQIVSMKECLSLMQNLMQIRCSLSHVECDSHTVHKLTQQHLLPPLTSRVKSSLFTHAHSSPLSLIARLHWCLTNHSRYINNGWTFSRPTLCNSKHTFTYIRR